ncbi:MAG: hypothetical protein HPY61_13625 [Methanotrichaceae archaeon]|nr:hypothetical protein [Methanotrichaceae archaeon]
MAGVLGQFSWPFSRRAELCGPRFMPVDPRVLELQTAKEILAEIFQIDLQEVEGMIRERCEEGVQQTDQELWPERLWVEETPADAGQVF